MLAEQADEPAELANIGVAEGQKLGPGGRCDRLWESRIGGHDHMRRVGAAELLERCDLRGVEGGPVLHRDHAVLKVVHLDGVGIDWLDTPHGAGAGSCGPEVGGVEL